MQSERSLPVRHRLVLASVPVFKTDSASWPALLELVLRPAPDSLEFAMYLGTYLVQHLAPAFVSENLDAFLGLTAAAFEGGEIDVMATACGLVAVLVMESGEEDLPRLAEPFDAVLRCWSAALAVPEDATKLVEKVCFGVTCERLPIEFDVVLHRLFECVPTNRVLSFGPIIDLVKEHIEAAEPFVDDILTQTLEVAVGLFGADEGSDDTAYVLSIVDSLSKASRDGNFFKLLLDLVVKSIQQRNAVNATVCLMALDRIIGLNQDSVTENLPAVVSVLIHAAGIDFFTTRATVIDIIRSVATLLEEGENPCATQFIHLLTTFLSDAALLPKALSSLSKLLLSCDIPVDLIDPLLAQLLELMPLRPAKVMEAVASLIFSAGDDITPFVARLIPVVLQGAVEDDAPDYRMKALSNLVRFASAAFGDDLPRAIDVIVQAGLTTDFDVRASVLASLSNVLLAGADRFADQIQALVNASIAEEIQSGDKNDDDEEARRTRSTA
jgi:hypothetical protein